MVLTINHNKMTAVEFLEEELKANLKKVILEGNSELMESLFDQAKEMEEKQMIDFAIFTDDYFEKADTLADFTIENEDLVKLFKHETFKTK